MHSKLFVAPKARLKQIRGPYSVSKRKSIDRVVDKFIDLNGAINLTPPKHVNSTENETHMVSNYSN